MSNRYHHIATYALYILIPAIIYSKALITICYVVIGLVALISFIDTKHFVWSKRLGSLTLIGLAIVISGINSDHTGQWLLHTIIKLPFIILPLAYMALPKFDSKVIFRVHILLIFVLCCSVIPVLVDSVLNVESTIERISMGQSVHTPIEHVKYSMFIAYAIVSGFICATFYRDQLKNNARWAILGGSLFLFVSLHLMAIRSGIVICYVSLMAFGLYYLYRAKLSMAYKVISASLAVLFVLAMSQTPMIQAKLGYMLYDWRMYVQNGGVYYSDSERLFSLQVGIDLWKEHIILGTGIGDLWESCKSVYSNSGRTDVINYPHSQLIYLLAGTGLIGFILFLVGYLRPIWRIDNKYRLLLYALYLNYSLSFIVENSMERSISVAFFLLAVIPLIHQQRD